MTMMKRKNTGKFTQKTHSAILKNTSHHQLNLVDTEMLSALRIETSVSGIPSSGSYERKVNSTSTLPILQFQQESIVSIPISS